MFVDAKKATLSAFYDDKERFWTIKLTKLRSSWQCTRSATRIMYISPEKSFYYHFCNFSHRADCSLFRNTDIAHKANSCSIVIVFDRIDRLPPHYGLPRKVLILSLQKWAPRARCTTLVPTRYQLFIENTSQIRETQIMYHNTVQIDDSH